MAKGSFIKSLQLSHDPDFLIIGAQKSGTGTLHKLLGKHPLLVGSNPKELHYFEKFINFPGKDLNWYRSHFKGWPWSNVRYFETTPSYLYHAKAAENIHSQYPNIKLIVILRNPVSRAFSAWNMYFDFFKAGIIREVLSDGFEPGKENLIFKHFLAGRSNFPTFSEAIKIELDVMQRAEDAEPALLRRGLYYKQFLNYQQFFDKSQFLVLGFGELTRDSNRVGNKILEFLQLDSKWVPQKEIEVRNKRVYDYPLENQDKSFLEDFYREGNTKLFELIGKELDW